MAHYEDGKIIWKNHELGIVARYMAFEVYKKPYKCEKCDRKHRLEIHHKDKNRRNNEETNLRVLCKFHHNELHGRMLPNNEIEDLNPGDIIAMYVVERAPISHIMDRFCCSRSTVLKALKNAGVEKRKSKRTIKAMNAIRFH
jgi:hypothetical protein